MQFLGLDNCIHNEACLALCAKLELTRKKLHAYGQGIKIAPDRKTGQRQKNVIGKEKPDRLVIAFHNLHAAIIEHCLGYSLWERPFPGQPEYLAHGAHADIFTFRQTRHKM